MFDNYKEFETFISALGYQADKIKRFNPDNKYPVSIESFMQNNGFFDVVINIIDKDRKLDFQLSANLDIDLVFDDLKLAPSEEMNDFEKFKVIDELIEDVVYKYIDKFKIQQP